MKAISNFAALDLEAMPAIGAGRAGVYRVEQRRADADSLAGFGRPVADFQTAEVTIVTWPQPGWRPIVDGTGNEGGVVEDRFVMQRFGEVQEAVNNAVGRRYVTGWFADPGSASRDRMPADTSRIFTHEANYHPDGGQIFFAQGGEPFVLLLAPPGDDLAPEKFVAFYCGGSFGVHVDPGVWHQPAFPVNDRVVFDNKQGRVHACVSCSFLNEFGVYLEVPLLAPQGAESG